LKTDQHSEEKDLRTAKRKKTPKTRTTKRWLEKTTDQRNRGGEENLSQKFDKKGNGGGVKGVPLSPGFHGGKFIVKNTLKTHSTARENKNHPSPTPSRGKVFTSLKNVRGFLGLRPPQLFVLT